LRLIEPDIGALRLIEPDIAALRLIEPDIGALRLIEPDIGALRLMPISRRALAPGWVITVKRVLALCSANL